jgi:hypothetical protein
VKDSHNPLNLEIGDDIVVTGEGWSERLRGKVYTISEIDGQGHAVFRDEVGDTWRAFEHGNNEWSVRHALTPVVAHASVSASDPVNHPAHYKTASGLEAIDVMEAFNLHRDGRLFNAGKYILRAGQKDKESQDIRKAIWYLERYAADLESRDQ